jgi:Fe-Mn family superoxide dismutase
MIRGIGWAALYQDPVNKKLINMWIEEHNMNHFPNGRLILIMDVFEHAYMPDYGTDREKYAEAFFKNINWDEVNARLMP